MSQDADEELPRLSEVFREGMAQNDQNMAVAFVLVLDEVDRRQGLIESDIEQNGQLFVAMTKALMDLIQAQAKLPQDVRMSTQTALRGIEQDFKTQSHEGALLGAKDATRGLEALERAVEHYQAQRTRLTTLAVLGLPTAFCAAVVLGLLLGSFAIPKLPPQWEWTC